MGTKVKLYRASLLDRFIDNEPYAVSEISTFRGYDLQKYKAAVKRDLSALLNTRTSTPAKIYDNEELTVLDYGMPDFAHYSPDDSEDRAILASRIANAVRWFEPRIKNPRVEIEPELNEDKSITVYISGVLVLHKEVVPVSFITNAQFKAGRWMVNERPR